jgi:cystine transport system permease protein
LIRGPRTGRLSARGLGGQTISKHLRQSLARWLAIAAALSLGLCTSALAQPGGDPAKARGVLRVGMEGTYPPFNYEDASGQLTGFEVDLAKALAARMGVRVELQTAPFAGLLASLDSGRNDVIINQVTITPDRQKKYDFTQPYSISGIQMIVRRGEQNRFRGPTDLAGHPVGVGLGTNYEAWLRAHQTGAIIKTYDDDPTKYQDLRLGRIDAVLNDKLTAMDMMRRTGGVFVAGGKPFAPQEMGIAVRKDQPALLADLNQALAAMRADGELVRISNKWFGADVTPPASTRADSGLGLIWRSAPFLLAGAAYTVGLSLASMTIGLAIGLGLALMRISGQPGLSIPARVYISAFRGTPLLVQLFLIYYGLPQFGIRLEPIPSALIGFSLNIAAYTAEILRGAITAVDRGQWEAAAVIGMSPAQTMGRVILPQAARTALPPLGNSFISLVKDTSLAATIQVPELFRQAQLITARTFEVFAMYLSAAALYWALSTLLAQVQGLAEARAGRHLRRR